MHAALKLQCGRVTGNKKFTIGGLVYQSSIQPNNVVTMAMKVLLHNSCNVRS